jgi:hypothetical protein
LKECRQTPKDPTHAISDKTLHPDYGTPQQVGTNREQQQHRDVPPSKKKTIGEE